MSAIPTHLTRGDTIHVDRDASREVTLRIAWEHEPSDGVTPASTIITRVEVEEMVFFLDKGKRRHVGPRDMSREFARHLGALLAEQIGLDRLLEIVAEDRQ